MKTAQQIIDLIRSETQGVTDKGIADALLDGEALRALGITDEDQSAVEEAYSLVLAKQDDQP